jgi:hypothetical protein
MFLILLIILHDIPFLMNQVTLYESIFGNILQVYTQLHSVPECVSCAVLTCSTP